MPQTPTDLPAELRLPLQSGEPWWYFTGGRPSVDFANTLRERWWRQVETLVTPRDLKRWLTRAGVLPGPGEPTAASLRSARDLREAIDGAFSQSIAGRAPAPADVETINRWLARAARPLRLVERRSELALEEEVPAEPVEQALGLLALDAAQILGDAAQRRRLRICASETCSARFFDNSPAGRRQWCSMRACGNVAKARRHRALQARQHQTRS